MKRRVPLLFGALILGSMTGGCIDEQVLESAQTVATFQTGTISALRDRRGTGPFRTYPYPPGEMLSIVEAAAGKARGAGGEPVRAIFTYQEGRSRELIAKERGAEDAAADGYEGSFRTALYVAVIPVVGDPARSRVEIHALARGPFHRGVVRWTRDMPTWIDEVIAEREAIESGPVKALPK